MQLQAKNLVAVRAVSSCPSQCLRFSKIPIFIFFFVLLTHTCLGKYDSNLELRRAEVAFRSMPSPAGRTRSSRNYKENESPLKKRRMLDLTKVDTKQKEPAICEDADVLWDETYEDQRSSLRLMNNMHDKITMHECTYLTPQHVAYHMKYYGDEDSLREQAMTKNLYFKTWKLRQHYLFPSDLQRETMEMNCIYNFCHSTKLHGQKIKHSFENFGKRLIVESVDMVLSRRTPTIAMDDVKANVGLFGSTCARVDVERDLWAGVTGDWEVLDEESMNFWT